MFVVFYTKRLTPLRAWYDEGRVCRKELFLNVVQYVVLRFWLQMDENFVTLRTNG